MSLATGLAFCPFGCAACDFCATSAFFLCAAVVKQILHSTHYTGMVLLLQQRVKPSCASPRGMSSDEELSQPFKSAAFAVAVRETGTAVEVVVPIVAAATPLPLALGL
jgi:hypothetical protein